MYYIIFSDGDSQGEVVGYGRSGMPSAGTQPPESEEIFETYVGFSSRLSELGINAGSEESYNAE